MRAMSLGQAAPIRCAAQRRIPTAGASNGGANLLIYDVSQYLYLCDTAPL